MNCYQTLEFVILLKSSVQTRHKNTLQCTFLKQQLFVSVIFMPFSANSLCGAKTMSSFEWWQTNHFYTIFAILPPSPPPSCGDPHDPRPLAPPRPGPTGPWHPGALGQRPAALGNWAGRNRFGLGGRCRFVESCVPEHKQGHGLIQLEPVLRV